MKPSTLKSLALATVFLCVAPFTQANDLSLPSSAKNFHLAAYAPASGTNNASNDEILNGIDRITLQEIDIWERIRQGFSIPDLANPRVDAQLKWYLARPDYIQRTTDRASRYLFYIVQELEARGMPTELALLPFIESAFNPHAKSRAKAVGMWQFIPSTGRNFNLNQSTLKDERRNVLASTEAALNYLQRLHRMFGDWQIALAAYNCGEGNVQRAVRKTQAAGEAITFNNLSQRMPPETRDYMPKLQAVKQIVANPARYNIALPKIDDQPFFVTIGKTYDMDVKVAATLAELPMDDFRALNPQFGRHVITGGKNTIILLPQQNADKFKANLEQWRKEKKPLSSWTTYKVTQPREKVETIAKQFNTTPQTLREVNHIPAKMLLKAGSTLLVPKSGDTPHKDIAPEVADNASIATVADAPAIKHIKIKVKKRDTLQSLAKRYNVKPAQIKSWNHLKSNKLVVGAKLDLQVPAKIAKGKTAKGQKLAKKGKAKPKSNKKKAVAHNKRTKKSDKKDAG